MATRREFLSAVGAGCFRHEAHRSELFAHFRDLEEAHGVLRVWPSAANFLLVELEDATRAFSRARTAGLLVRDVRAQPGLDRALRITVGTREQNERLLEAWR